MHKYIFIPHYLNAHYTPCVQTTCCFLSENPNELSPSGAFRPFRTWHTRPITFMLSH